MRGEGGRRVEGAGGGGGAIPPNIPAGYKLQVSVFDILFPPRKGAGMRGWDCALFNVAVTTPTLLCSHSPLFSVAVTTPTVLCSHSPLFRVSHVIRAGFTVTWLTKAVKTNKQITI